MESVKFIGPKELAKLLGVPINTIYYWVSKKQIPFVKMGKHNRFNFQEVLEFFKKGHGEN